MELNAMLMVLHPLGVVKLPSLLTHSSGWRLLWKYRRSRSGDVRFVALPLRGDANCRAGTPLVQGVVEVVAQCDLEATELESLPLVPSETSVSAFSQDRMALVSAAAGAGGLVVEGPAKDMQIMMETPVLASPPEAPAPNTVTHDELRANLD